jgi:hypothetical protein
MKIELTQWELITLAEKSGIDSLYDESRVDVCIAGAPAYDGVCGDPECVCSPFESLHRMVDTPEPTRRTYRDCDGNLRNGRDYEAPEPEDEDDGLGPFRGMMTIFGLYAIIAAILFAIYLWRAL